MKSLGCSRAMSFIEEPLIIFFAMSSRSLLFPCPSLAIKVPSSSPTATRGSLVQYVRLSASVPRARSKCIDGKPRSVLTEPKRFFFEKRR